LSHLALNLPKVCSVDECKDGNIDRFINRLECGPMPNVMLPWWILLAPLFNAAKFGWRPLLHRVSKKRPTFGLL